jgi:hypothetical protein
VVNTYDDYNETRGNVLGLEAPLEFVDVNRTRALVGAIELSRNETLLVS